MLRAGALAQEVATGDRTHADIIVSGWREVDDLPDHGAVVRSVHAPPTFEIIEDDLLAGKSVPTSAALYRTATVASVRWDAGLAKLNDWDYFVKAALVSRRIESIDNCAYDWRSHPGERITSSSSTARAVDELYRILSMMIDALVVRDAFTPSRRRRAAQYLYKELRRLYVVEPSRARDMLRHISILDPRFVPTDEEPSAVFRTMGQIGLLRPSLEAYAFIKRRIPRK